MVASSVYEKQNGVPYVLEKGYIPCDKVREATSIAMEYAADDWGIALMAKKMGKTEDYQNYLKRGKYYTQYFDKDINFIRPKMNDGNWRTPYDPIQSIHSVGDFCEGNGWHYTFFVPQHPEGLIELMGGDAPFISKLDSLFLVEGELGENASPDISGLIGMYAQPSCHLSLSLRRRAMEDSRESSLHPRCVLYRPAGGHHRKRGLWPDVRLAYHVCLGILPSKSFQWCVRVR